MKKNYNYGQTEKWLSENFSASEKHIKYGGGALDRADDKPARAGFFQYPAVRIAGAFLALLIIGGSLFGALKTLERIGTQINPSHSENGKVKYVPGETDINCSYISICSDKKQYFPAVYLSTTEKTLPDGKKNIKSYSYNVSRIITVPYSPDLSVDSNVADKEMNIISIKVHNTADHLNSDAEFTDTAGLYDHLKNGDGGVYTVGLLVTWDKGDEINTYYVTFNVDKSEAADDENGSELISDINGVKTYDYGKKLAKLQKAPYDGDPRDLVRVLTGGKLYAVTVGRAYDAEHLSAVKHYDIDGDPTVIEFGGDLELYNNAADKDMEIISVTLTYPDGTTTSTGTLKKAFRSVYEGKAGTYVIHAYVSWDKPPEATVEDKYSVYCVYFALHKAESLEGGDNKVWYEEEKKDTKYSYLAVSIDNDLYYPPVVYSKHVKLVSDVSTVQKNINSDISKYKEIRIPYSGGALELLNNVYDKEKMTVVGVSVKNGSDAPAESPDTAEKLITYLKSAGAGTYRVSLELTWDTYPLINKGDQAYIYTAVFYVDKSDDTPGTDTAPAVTTSEDTAGPPDQNEGFDPSGLLRIDWIINNSTYKVYRPPVVLKRVYKDGAVIEELSYESDPCDAEYRYTDGLIVQNEARLNQSYSKRTWRVCSVTLNKEKEFKSFETAFEYIHDTAANSSGSVYVEATVTWDAGALINSDADRTEYTYAFNVIYTCPADIDPKADPYVTGIMKNWLSVVVGEDRYSPGISKKLVYNGDQVTGYEYYHDNIHIEWHPGDSVAVSNEIYSVNRIYGVTVNGIKYDNAEQAFAAMPTDRISHVEVEASWDFTDMTIHSDEVKIKTTFIFAFDIVPV